MNTSPRSPIRRWPLSPAHCGAMLLLMVAVVGLVGWVFDARTFAVHDVVAAALAIFVVIAVVVHGWVLHRADQRRRRAEEALRESEERLRLLGDNLPDSAIYQYIHDGDGKVRFVYFSRGIERLAGVRVEDVLRDPGTLLRQSPAEDQQRVLEVEARSARDLTDFEVEIPSRRPDGELRWLRLHSRPRRLPDGRTIWDGVHIDVTESKRAAARAEAELDALRRIHALSGRLLEAGGLQPLLQEIVDAAVAIVGAERGTLQRLEGDGLRIVAHHGHQPPFLEFFATSHEASVCGETLRRGERLVIADVEVSPLLAGTPSLEVLRAAGVRAVQCTPIVGRKGTLLGILATQWSQPHAPDEHDLWRIDLLVRQAADLIEYKALQETLEQQVVQRTAEADRRASQLRAMFADLSQAEQRERRRLAQILHDHLQQILVAARMKLQRLQRRVHADETLARMADEVDELIDQCIGESRSLTVELSPPVLYDGGLAAGLDWLARRVEEQHGLPVAVTADAAADPADMDLRAFLFQAVRELLLNVIKHARATQARVSRARGDNGELQLEVADDGQGCDPGGPAGAGAKACFGLFNIQQRLEVLGGRMTVTRAEGGGTRARLAVPPSVAAAAPPTSPLAPCDNAPTSTPVAPGRGGLRVLLADDHPLLRKGLADLLQEQPGIEVVVEARDGQEAVELALEARPDVIVMDITMPRLDGIEATRRIKARLPQVRIVGLSMHDDEPMRRAMCEAGADIYLRKDSAADALLAAVLLPARAAGS